MKPILLNTNTGKVEQSKIEEINKKEIPLKKNGWNFNWRELYKVEGGTIYKISLLNAPKDIQGVVMISVFNNELVLMNNIEVAPAKLGRDKLYDYVAGCLISYACLLSFRLGEGAYHGFLSFESKIELIELYQNKYGAQYAMGNKMFIEPQVGRKLIQKYLKIEF